MTLRDDRVSLEDMLSHSREAIALMADMSLDDLAQDRVVQLALTRLVEIVGEAANRVSDETRRKNQGIPWPQIIV